MRPSGAWPSALGYLAAGVLLVALDGRLQPSTGHVARAPLRVWVPAAATDAEVAAAVEDEVLIRFARQAGLDRSDTVVRSHTTRVVRELALDDGRPPAPDETFETAVALGIVDRDPVVRGRLRSLARLSLEALPPEQDVDDAALASYLHAHPERFSADPRMTFEHVFVRRNPVRARDRARAEALLSRLRRENPPPEVAHSWGDPSLRAPPVETSGVRRAGTDHGPAVAEALRSAPLARWVGPIESPLGFHLLRVRRRTPARPLPLAEVRNQVRGEVLAQRRKAHYARRYRRLRGRYEVVVVRGGETHS